MTTSSKPAQSTSGSSQIAGTASSPSAARSRLSSSSRPGKSRQVARPISGSDRLTGGVKCGDRLVARRHDREDLVQAGDLERLGDVRVGVDDRQRAVAGPDALDRADQHAEGGRVEERRLGEVDDDPVLADIDGAEQRRLEIRGGEEIDLAPDGDDVALVVEALL